MDIAWRSEYGQVNVLLRIAPAVPSSPDRPGFCCVRPVGVISCHFVETEYPRTGDLESLPVVLRFVVENLLGTPLLVHRAVVQHGSMQYLKRNAAGGLVPA